jgi:DNA polymerase-3 subunit delta'
MPFSHLLGHVHQLDLLSRAVARGSLPPSLLFAGPDGVGKLTVAAALAEVLNCETPTTRAVGGAEGASNGVDACGTCRPCRRLARGIGRLRAGDGAALDCLRLVVPDERDSIKVDVVRAVLAASAYKPFDGRRRVVIVDGAEALEVGAQNALLKVLEEPPAGTVFVLVSARPDALLATVRSRCSRVRFGPVPTGALVEYLVTRRRLDPAAAHAAASQADGSLGVALARAESGPDAARAAAGDVLRHVARGHGVSARLAAAQALIAKGDGGRGGRKGAAAVTRAEVTARLDAMAALLRDVQVHSTRAGDSALANADLAAELGQLGAAFEGERGTRAFAAVDRARFALDRHVNHKTVADWLAFEL